MDVSEILHVGAIGDVMSDDEFRAKRRRWTELAAEGHQTPSYTAAEIEAELESFHRTMSVEVREFADLADGRRIIDDSGLGFSSSAGAFGDFSGEIPHPWAGTSDEDLEDSIRFVVEADADDELPDHADLPAHAHRELSFARRPDLRPVWLSVRWARLIAAAAAEGVTLTADALEAAPFVFEFTDRLLATRARYAGGHGESR